MFMKFKTYTLKSLCVKIRNGCGEKQNDTMSGYPISRIETVSESKIEPKNIAYLDCDEKILEKFRLVKGDILFSHINSDTHIGKSAIYYGDPDILLHGVNLLLFRVNQEIILPEYLQFYLNKIKNSGYFSLRCNRAINQASINQKFLEKIKFSVPEIKDQKNFVKNLNKIKIFENKLEELNKDLFNYATNLFDEKFGSTLLKNLK